MGRARHPQRRVFRLAILGTASVLGALTVASTAAGALAAPAAKSVPAERWARTVCRSISDWMDETSIVDEQIGKLVEDVIEGDRKAATAKARMLVALKRATRAGDELTEDAKDAGTPKVARGATYARSLRETLAEMTGVYEEARVTIRKLDTSPAKRFARRAEQAYSASFEDFFEIGNPLEVLEDSPELAAAITATSFCTDVTDVYEGFVSLGVVPGDCLDANVEPIDCTEPHVDEVILVGQYPGAPDEPFPGNSAIEAWVDQNCLPAFEAYVGVNLEASDYDLSWFSPTTETWTAGDREMVCTVTGLNGEELDGSVRGGAQTL